jgi:hypothetical protein
MVMGLGMGIILDRSKIGMRLKRRTAAIAAVVPGKMPGPEGPAKDLRFRSNGQPLGRAKEK